MKKILMSAAVTLTLGAGLLFAAHTTTKRIDAIVPLDNLAAGDVIKVSVAYSTYTYTWYSNTIDAGLSFDGYATVHGTLE